jgi:hypothetical protein
MKFPADQIEELKGFCAGVSLCEDAGAQYLLLSRLNLPERCKPTSVDALLRPVPIACDGYPSRLFLAEQVQSPFARNWNFSGRICDRNWYAFSWMVPPGSRLAQMVLAHLEGFRKKE